MQRTRKKADPTNEPMVALEDVMMCIPDPREGTRDTDGDGQIGDNSSDENRVVDVLVVDEDQDDAENEPCET